MAVLREKIVRFTCNTCMYGIHFVWREWGGGKWAMGRGVKRASMRSYVRWWINSGHNVWSRCRGGGICVLGAGGTLGWGLMVRARIQGFWEIAQWGRGLLGRLLLRSVEGKSG